MDMIFNLGATKFSLGNWPNLFPAVNQRDWETAANESHRVLGKDENGRNQDTYSQFMDAKKMEDM